MNSNSVLKVDFKVPRGWHELSTRNLKYLFSLMAKEFPLDVIIILAFLNWSGASIITRSKYNPQEFLLRYRKNEFPISVQQLTEFAMELDWIKKLPDSPVRFQKIRGHVALPADFQDVPFESFIICENFYQGYLTTQNDELLDDLGSTLYQCRSRHRFSAVERINMFYWFAALKMFFSKMFPDFFQPLASEPENLMGSPDVGKNLRSAMNNQIRALTKGDITKEATVLHMDTWRALTELDAQAREYKELNAKTHGK